MKKIILMLLLVFNLVASEGFEEDFGPLLRVGITRFQSANLYVKSDNGSFVVKADDSEFPNGIFLADLFCRSACENYFRNDL